MTTTDLVPAENLAALDTLDAAYRDGSIYVRYTAPASLKAVRA